MLWHQEQPKLQGKAVTPKISYIKLVEISHNYLFQRHHSLLHWDVVKIAALGKAFSTRTRRQILCGFWIFPRSKCWSTWEQGFSLEPELIIMLSRKQVAIHLPSCHISTFCYKELNLQISAWLCSRSEKQNGKDYQPQKICVQTQIQLT